MAEQSDWLSESLEAYRRARQNVDTHKHDERPSVQYLVEDLREAVDSFIDPLDENLLALQELAAVLACSDRRFLPERHAHADRAALREAYESARRLVRA